MTKLGTKDIFSSSVDSSKNYANSRFQEWNAFGRVVYRDVMTASRRHDTTGRDGPLCHDTIGSA